MGQDQNQVPRRWTTPVPAAVWGAIEGRWPSESPLSATRVVQLGAGPAETQYELALWNVLLSIILGILYGIGDAAGDGAAPLIIGAGGHRERAESVLAGKRAPSAGSDASADDQRVVAWSASSYSRRIWSPPPLRHPLMIWSKGAQVVTPVNDVFDSVLDLLHQQSPAASPRRRRRSPPAFSMNRGYSQA